MATVKPEIEKIKKELFAGFDTFAVEHFVGHQPDKLNRYAIEGSGLCFAFEKNLSTQVNIWCPMKVAAYVSGVEKEPYPASNVYKEKGSTGEPKYGRHAGLDVESFPLRDIDLVRFIVRRSEEGKIVVEAIKLAANYGIE